MKNKYKKSAFTLIELLVVITIIGILSTIGVATFNSYIRTAKETKAFSFERDISKELKRQAIITETKALGLWNFDNTLNDLSGKDHHFTEVIAGRSFEEPDNIFLGSHYIQFSGGRIFASLNDDIPNGSFTISYLVKTPNTPLGDAFFMSTDATFIRSNLADATSIFLQPFSVVKPSSLDNDRWHHVLFTYDDNDLLKFYLDGEFIEEKTVSNTVTFANWIQIGYGGSPVGANFALDNLEIYPFAVDPNF